MALFTLNSSENNKNLWNCICSAIDWISIAVDYIIKMQHENLHDLNGMEVYSIISSIDIIVEAIEQLHRVIMPNSEKIFSKDKEIFIDNIFEQTDREYFKMLRSCFGAHPVNIKEPGTNPKDPARRFASWPGKFGSKDYGVLLYSNQLSKENIYLGINLQQLFSFMEKYYNYINILILELKKQYTDFCLEMQGKKIICEGSPISRIYILQKECSLRLNFDYYKSTLNELKIIFETPITHEENLDLVNQYRIALERLIDEIEINLQNMVFTELENDKIIDFPPDSCRGLPDGWYYYVQKIIENVFSYNNDYFLWEDKIQTIFMGKFVFSYETVQELYVLVQAALYNTSILK